MPKSIFFSHKCSKGKCRSLITICSLGSILLPHNFGGPFILGSFSHEVIPCVLGKREASPETPPPCCLLMWCCLLVSVIKCGMVVWYLHQMQRGLLVLLFCFVPSSWHVSLPFIRLRFPSPFLQHPISPRVVASDSHGSGVRSSIPRGLGLVTA